jgi:hypothetical protein
VIDILGSKFLTQKPNFQVILTQKHYKNLNKLFTNQKTPRNHLKTKIN